MSIPIRHFRMRARRGDPNALIEFRKVYTSALDRAARRRLSIVPARQGGGREACRARSRENAIDEATIARIADRIAQMIVVPAETPKESISEPNVLQLRVATQQPNCQSPATIHYLGREVATGDTLVMT